MMKTLRVWSVGLAAGALLLGSSWDAGATFSSVYVFGDSLSDNGNLYRASGGLLPPPAYGYYAGRASNGPVAVEQMASQLVPGGSSGIHFFDYAYAGAYSGTGNVWNYGTSAFPGLLEQVGSYATAFHNLQTGYPLDPTLQMLFPGGVAIDPTALYVVWAGSNDFNSGIPNVTTAVGNIVQAVQTLTGLGVMNILVPNLPNIGLTPRAQAQGAFVVGLLTQASMGFNALLQGQLTALDQSLAATIYQYDVFGLMQDVFANPLAHGFQSNGSYLLTCSGPTPPAACGNPNNYVFFDDLHPTALAHSLIGDGLAQAVPLPAAFGLFAAALGLLGLGARRRSVA